MGENSTVWILAVVASVPIAQVRSALGALHCPWLEWISAQGTIIVGSWMGENVCHYHGTDSQRQKLGEEYEEDCKDKSAAIDILSAKTVTKKLVSNDRHDQQS